MNKTCEKTFKNDNQKWKTNRSYIYIEYRKLNHHYHHPACIRTCIYAHLHHCPCMFVKRFQSFASISFSLITCVHHVHIHMREIDEEKKVDLGLLYWSSFFTIWDRSCETNLLKRITKKKRGEKKIFHTSNAHFY
jgi:hypothetical protein